MKNEKIRVDAMYCQLMDRMIAKNIFTPAMRKHVEESVLSQWDSCDDVTDSSSGIIYYRNAKSRKLNDSDKLESYKLLKVNYYQGIIYAKNGKIRIETEFNVPDIHLVVEKRRR